MSVRIIAEFTGTAPDGTPRRVKVYFDSDIREYVARVWDNDSNLGLPLRRHSAVDYFTEDKADALATARQICGESFERPALSPLESMLPGMPVSRVSSFD